MAWLGAQLLVLPHELHCPIRAQQDVLCPLGTTRSAVGALHSRRGPGKQASKQASALVIN